jgi:hypothetical protein
VFVGNVSSIDMKINKVIIKNQHYQFANVNEYDRYLLINIHYDFAILNKISV